MINFHKRTSCFLCAALVASSVCFSLVGCGENDDGADATLPPLVLEDAGGVDSVVEEPTRPAEEEPTATAIPAYLSADITFTGKAYVIADARSGEVLLSKNPDDRLYIASITKLLTALVALDYFAPSDRITVEDGWFWLLERDKDIDAYGMKVGENYSVDDIMKMLIIKSYGDAALSLENAVAEKAGRPFTELMNEKAAGLGMTASHFDNSIGLDIGNDFTENYSTAADTAKLMKAAYENTYLFEICMLRTATLENGAVLKHTAKLFNGDYCNEKYNVLGGKTGSTNASGVSIACVSDDLASDKSYIIIYLNGNSTTNMCNEIAEMLDIMC